MLHKEHGLESLLLLRPHISRLLTRPQKKLGTKHQKRRKIQQGVEDEECNVGTSVHRFCSHQTSTEFPHKTFFMSRVGVGVRFVCCLLFVVVVGVGVGVVCCCSAHKQKVTKQRKVKK